MPYLLWSRSGVEVFWSLEACLSLPMEEVGTTGLPATSCLPEQVGGVLLAGVEGSDASRWSGRCSPTSPVSILGA